VKVYGLHQAELDAFTNAISGGQERERGQRRAPSVRRHHDRYVLRHLTGQHWLAFSDQPRDGVLYRDIIQAAA